MQPQGSRTTSPAAARALEKPPKPPHLHRWGVQSTKATGGTADTRDTARSPWASAGSIGAAPASRWCPRFEGGTLPTSHEPPAKQDVRAAAAAGRGPVGRWEGSKSKGGALKTSSPPPSPRSRGRGFWGAPASPEHGRRKRNNGMGGERGAEGGKIAPYSTFIKEASSRPKNLMSYFSKKNSCCGTLRPSIFWPGLHVVDIG